jgi:hypothetical protein
MAGQIYEQIGEYRKSICAYLKAYSYEQQTENCPETVRKIGQLCSILLEQPNAEIQGKKFRKLKSLSLAFSRCK